MKKWNIFFGLATVLIVTTEVLPGALGLFSITQWGGMYTDGWCSVFTRSNPLQDLGRTPTPEETDEHFQAPTTRVVWSAPMHTLESCFAWSQSWCEKSHRDGWRIYHSQPYYRQSYPFGEQNVCDLPRLDPPWFIQNFNK
ncbi:MAG: hypothetical protein O2904_03655 [bacterium]|nr:hypothetical protein [bacterium]